MADALKSHHRLILNAPSVDDRRSVVFPAIERPIPNKGKPEFAPIAFSPNRKLSKDEKHTAALAGTAISSWHALDVKYVRVIHGPEFLSTKLVLLGKSGPTHLAKESLAALHDLETLADNPAPPPMYLNNHCGVCEYRDRCRKDAVARDDLSLLRGLQPKEIEAWKKRGIFTVTQLSYTFRAKTMGRSSQQPKRHSQPLQAMAIRDKKDIHSQATGDADPNRRTVYFDVEGIPEREFFYLIGVVVASGGTTICPPVLGGRRCRRRICGQDFLRLLAGLGDYVLVHFGRYERDFIREMQRRYPFGGEEETERLVSRLFDVHGAIRTNVFFPVYGNSIKEIAPFLGFQWQGAVRSGTDSIVHRYRWEKTKDESLKEDLLRYNDQDCLAVVAVFDHLASLGKDPIGIAVQCEETDGLPDAKGSNFSRKAFATPALKAITKCAYFNYQQEKGPLSHRQERQKECNPQA